MTKELISRGYKVVVFSREKAGVKGAKGMDDVIADFPGAHKVVFGEVKARTEKTKTEGCAILSLALLRSLSGPRQI